MTVEIEMTHEERAITHVALSLYADSLTKLAVDFSEGEQRTEFERKAKVATALRERLYR